ncbi:MAG: protein-export chaperone SecB, partial [Pseudomonadota bacterium]
MEVSLRITITASQEETVVFIAEVDYAGVFVAEGFDEAEIEHIVKVHCPTILFPYVRETLDSTIVKGNFPPLLLAPLNFEGIYRDAQSDSLADETAH